MAEQVITIRTKTEVAALDRLEKKLEEQIVTAKVLGGEYKHLEEQLGRTRQAMNGIPAAQRVKANLMNTIEEIPGIGGLVSRFSGPAGAIGVVTGMARAYQRLATDGFDVAKAVGEVSRQTQVSAENVQSFAGVLSNFGTTADKSASGLQRFNEKLGDARLKGGESKALFDAIGISIDGKSTDEVLKQTLSGINGVGDSAKRNRIAVELFGDAGRNLADAFKEGAESLERFKKANGGEIFTSDEIRNVEEVDAVIKRLTGQARVGASKSAIAALTLDIEKLFNIAVNTPMTIGPQFLRIATVYGEVKGAQDALAKSTADTVAAQREVTAELERQIVLIEQQAAAFGRMQDEMKKAEDRGKFKSVGEIVEAGKAGKLRTPEQKQEFGIAQGIQELERRAEELRGVDPAESTRLFSLAEDAKRRLPSLASSAKPFGPPRVPLPMDEPKGPNAPVPVTGPGMAGALDAAIRQAFAETDQKDIAQILRDEAKARKMANDMITEAAKLGASNTAQIIGNMTAIINKMQEQERKIRNLELREKLRPN